VPVIEAESRFIRTHDGYDIAAAFFRPPGIVRASVLIAPAMGVSQRFYAALADWLASRGFLVVTFDFRGIGLSRRADLRTLDTTISDWAESDWFQAAPEFQS